MSTVNNMQIQDDEGNVFHPETSIEQIVGENGTQVFPGGKPGNMESSDMTAAFDEVKMRENIKSGEKHRVLFGKIQKFFADLKTVAFSGKYGDLSERPTLGGAAGYKVADNDTTNNSEFLTTARVAYEHGQEIDALSRDFVNFQSSFRDGCSAIAAAIVDMGVPTADNASPDELAANIRKIKQFSVIKKGRIQGAKHTWDISDITGYKTFELYQNIFPVVDGGIHTANNYSKSISFSYDHTKGIVSSIGSLGEGYDHVGITLYVVF